MKRTWLKLKKPYQYHSNNNGINRPVSNEVPCSSNEGEVEDSISKERKTYYNSYLIAI